MLLNEKNEEEEEEEAKKDTEVKPDYLIKARSYLQEKFF